MSHVFISYKREDQARVAPLVDALRAAGIETWWDQDIPPGGSWRETIAEKLDGSHLCVAIWSSNSVGTGGRFVREEAERAARRSAYLGVLIENVPPPFGFSEWQAIDLSAWRGAADDPQLRYFVETVRAQLAGEAAPKGGMPAPAAVAKPRPRLKPALIGLAAVILVGVAIAIYALLPGRSAPQSATEFVTERLARERCSWTATSSIETAPDGAHIRLAGIHSAPESLQSAIMEEAAAASVGIAAVDVRDVAAAPPQVCAELDMLRPYRALATDRRLRIIQPTKLERDGEELFGAFAYEVDYARLPPRAALFGLDSIEGVHAFLPDLHAYRRENQATFKQADVERYNAVFGDNGRGGRNVGLILMTSNSPIDQELVKAIGTDSSPEFRKRFDEAARANGWRFELGLVYCGFEGEGLECRR